MTGILTVEAFKKIREVLKALISTDKIKENLRTQFIGRKLHAYDAVSSTNDVAKALTLEEAEEGTVIIAETQTKGRGRVGREWFSPKGGLWFSIILKPKIKAKEVSRITLAVGVAVAKALKRQLNLNASVQSSISHREGCPPKLRPWLLAVP